MGKDWVDFRVVKQAVSMEMVLGHFHIDWLRGSNHELRGRCPIHKGEGDRSFHVNLSKNVFNCFSCKKHGNVLDLVAALDGSTVRDAALKLKGIFSPEGNQEGAQHPPGLAGRNDATAEPEVINPPLSFQLMVDFQHPYGQDRGVSRETLERFGAGLCGSKGTFARRFIFPLHRESGELVGYAGRSIDDQGPKYLFPPKEKGFHKSHLVYNLHRVCDLQSRRQPYVVVVEGFFDCMKVTDAGFPCVALIGSSLSVRQEELLTKCFSQIVLLFDGDAAGRGATEDCLRRLGRHCWMRAVSVEDGVQPDQLSIEAIEEILRPVVGDRESCEVEVVEDSPMASENNQARGEPDEPVNLELPKRITRRWLQGLSDEDLRKVEKQLSEESGSYQSYDHARVLSDQWHRAYDELLRRGLVVQKQLDQAT